MNSEPVDRLPYAKQQCLIDINKNKKNVTQKPDVQPNNQYLMVKNKVFRGKKRNESVNSYIVKFNKAIAAVPGKRVEQDSFTFKFIAEHPEEIVGLDHFGETIFMNICNAYYRYFLNELMPYNDEEDSGYVNNVTNMDSAPKTEQLCGESAKKYFNTVLKDILEVAKIGNHKLCYESDDINRMGLKLQKEVNLHKDRTGEKHPHSGSEFCTFLHTVADGSQTYRFNTKTGTLIENPSTDLGTIIMNCYRNPIVVNDNYAYPPMLLALFYGAGRPNELFHLKWGFCHFMQNEMNCLVALWKITKQHDHMSITFNENYLMKFELSLPFAYAVYFMLGSGLVHPGFDRGMRSSAMFPHLQISRSRNVTLL